MVIRKRLNYQINFYGKNVLVTEFIRMLYIKIEKL